MLHALSDGSRVRIRPIAPDDGPRLAAGMRALSPESARRRFLAPKPSLSAHELRYLTDVDGVDHLALVAVTADDRIVGVARCVRSVPGDDTAELAIVVGDAQQGQRLGAALLRALADAACRVGIRRFTATTLADNRAVEGLLAGVATALDGRHAEGGVRELVAWLPDCGAAPIAA
jgi:RimJ/RimL family protein N-acetyltransferase